MNSLAPPRPDQARPSVSDLTAAMTSRRAKIGVIGLGYVGLPLALAAAKAGFATLGFDVDEPRVRQINRGESFIKRIPAASIAAAVSEGKFAALPHFWCRSSAVKAGISLRTNGLLAWPLAAGVTHD